MKQRPRCEVCDGLRPGAVYGERYRVIEVAFDARTVRLCVAHARIAEGSGVKSFDELRELYGEGRRSFVPRRGMQRPGSGRRATDLR